MGPLSKPLVDIVNFLDHGRTSALTSSNTMNSYHNMKPFSMQEISQSDFACSQLDDDRAYPPVGSLMRCKNLLRWLRRESM